MRDRERERERQRHRQREKKAPRREPNAGHNPGGKNVFSSSPLTSGLTALPRTSSTIMHKNGERGHISPPAILARKHLVFYHWL